VLLRSRHLSLTMRLSSTIWSLAETFSMLLELMPRARRWPVNGVVIQFPSNHLHSSATMVPILLSSDPWMSLLLWNRMSKPVAGQSHLDEAQKTQRFEVLSTWTKLFSGKLGCYPKRKFHIDLKPGTVPYRCKCSYSIPTSLRQVAKDEFKRQVELKPWPNKAEGIVNIACLHWNG